MNKNSLKILIFITAGGFWILLLFYGYGISKSSCLDEYTAPRGYLITYAHRQSDEVFGPDQWDSLYRLWDEQSGWDYKTNHTKFGCGIPGVFPCNRISKDPYEQIDWGIGYIEKTYGTPDKALERFYKLGWY